MSFLSDLFSLLSKSRTVDSEITSKNLQTKPAPISIINTESKPFTASDASSDAGSDYNADKAKIINYFGGVSGLIDSGIPPLAFLLAFNITKDLNESIYISLAVVLLITIVRLAMRDTIKHSMNGLFAVLISALFAHYSHKATGFFLPSVLKAAGFSLLYLISILVKWPLIGVMVGPILGENLSWRKDELRRKAYSKATWVWFGLFFLRFVTLLPLYLSQSVNYLGIATVLLGYPPFFLTMWLTWMIIKKSAATKNI